jgi:hypothetical protein
VYYKLGFTSKTTLLARMSYGGHGDEKLIDKEILFCRRSDAYLIEQRLLKHFRKQLAFKQYSNDPSLPMPGRGQSELFKFDALGLDDDVYGVPSTEVSQAAKDQLDEQGSGCAVMLIGKALAPFALGLSIAFILFGGMAFFQKTETRSVGALRRPMHPPAIQQLIEELKRHCSLQEKGDV